MKSDTTLNRDIKIIAKNRRARHDYEIVQEFEAGIQLLGSEVKSLRNGKVSLQEAYAGFKRGNDEELFIFDMHINPYEQSSMQNHEPKRPRKLLLHRREIDRLKVAVKERGFTIIPLAIYFSGHLVKLTIALAKAKRKYDKRETKKERQSEREIRKKFRL